MGTGCCQCLLVQVDTKLRYSSRTTPILKNQPCKHACLELGAQSIICSLEMAEAELPNTVLTRLVNSHYLSQIRAQSVTGITKLRLENIFSQLCEISTDFPTWFSGSVNRLISGTTKKMPLKCLWDWKQDFKPIQGGQRSAMKAEKQPR